MSDNTQSANYKLSSLEITNFRQYQHTKIEFSQDPTKTFTILKGVNGAGKTNIMNAITWCLYGTEKHMSSNEKDLPIINTKAIMEKPNGLINMSVILTLADENGEKFRIERELRLYNGGKTDARFDSEFGIMIPDNSTPVIKESFQWYDPGAGWKSTDYFKKSIKNILPEDLSSYFLFDGEKLEDFFDQADDTKKGIEDVSQIKMAEQAIGTLKNLINQKRRDAKNLDPQVQSLQAQLQEEEHEIKELKNRIDKTSTELDKKRERVHDIEQSLTKEGGDVGNYQSQLKTIKSSIEQLDDYLDQAKERMQSYIIENMSGVLSLKEIVTTLDMIAKKGDEGILPPKIKNTFLREILNEGVCICGSDISDGTTHHEKVKKLLKNAEYSEISNLCSDIKFGLRPLCDIETTKSDLKKHRDELAKYRDDLNTKENERKELEAKIGNVDSISIQKIQKEKIKLLGEISELDQKIGGDTQKHDDRKNFHEKLERAYDNEVRKDGKHKDLIYQLEFCNDSLNGLERVKNELLEEVRIKVQKFTKDYFLKFIWKKDTYNGVKINDDYKITATHVHGYDVQSSLSKGEKLVLALSFMSALRKITGFRFPLIIDTPLGRVSGEPRHNIALTLPKFLENTQVTLLVTDTEYQGQIIDKDNKRIFPPVSETIEKNVGLEYTIEFNQSVSEVIQK